MAITSVIDTSNKVPRAYIRVSLGVGRRSPGSAAIRVLLVGNKLAAGTMAVDTPVQAFSRDDARTYAGAGSELFMMAAAAFAAFPNVELWLLAVTESVGAAASSNAIKFTGTASASGTVQVWVGGRRCVARIASGDTATDVGAAVAAAINAQTDWPVTAANTTGTVTVTAKQKGPRGGFIRLRSLQTDGAGLSHTAVNELLSGGTTPDDPQGALDAIASTRFHYIVTADSDSTNVPKFKTHCEGLAEPETGIRQHFWYASIDTLGNATTLSDAVNAKRGRLVWHAGADDTPGEIAAATAAVHANRFAADRARNMDGETVPGLRPQYSAADKPLNSELVSALNNGIMPLDHDGTTVRIVRSITNYSTDAVGNPDYSVLDTAHSEVPDFIADALEQNWLSEFQGFKLDNDPPQGEITESGVATPKTIKAWAYGILTTYAAGGTGPLLLQNVEAYKDQVVVELDSEAQGRANLVVPVDVVERFHQLAGDVRQVG